MPGGIFYSAWGAAARSAAGLAVSWAAGPVEAPLDASGISSQLWRLSAEQRLSAERLCVLDHGGTTAASALALALSDSEALGNQLP